MSGIEGEQDPIFGPRTRSLTFGILLGVTLVAFEALAVVTVAPLFAADLGGMELYGWVFSALLLTSLLGAVVGGQLADSGSLARPFALGLGLFALGLFVSGAAPTMEILIVGRVLQGLGGGAMTTVNYAALTRAYPDSSRARMMALTSSAWIVPALLGPTVAGLIAEGIGWRWVFWSILPLLALVATLTLRQFAALPAGTKADVGTSRLRAASLLTLGAGAFLVGIGLETTWKAVALAVPGAVIAGLGLNTLLPAGALRLRRGLPSVVVGEACSTRRSSASRRSWPSCSPRSTATRPPSPASSSRLAPSAGRVVRGCSRSSTRSTPTNARCACSRGPCC
ncbi:MAG: MFS transporter [Trueperaceae bacterium]|nr:MFS transporter [Trueperaceae bacterium]